MKVRSVNNKDLDPLTVLFEGYRTFYRKDPDPETARKFLYTRLVKKESKIYVCENPSGHLVGFVQLYSLFSSTRMKRLWLLNDLFVHPDARGLGVSKMLIESAKELAIKTGSAGLMLETEVSNDIGNKLYPQTGFKLIDQANFYSWDNPHSEMGIPTEFQISDPKFQQKPLHFSISIAIILLFPCLFLAGKYINGDFFMMGIYALFPLSAISIFNSLVGVILTWLERKVRKDAMTILIFQAIIFMMSTGVLVFGIYALMNVRWG